MIQTLANVNLSIIFQASEILSFVTPIGLLSKLEKTSVHYLGKNWKFQFKIKI